MTKLKKERRIAITDELEGLFAKYCRPCNVPDRENLKVCFECDHYLKIRELGNELNSESKRRPGDRIPQKVLDEAKKNGIKYSTLVRRLSVGVSFEDATRVVPAKRGVWTKEDDQKLLKGIAAGKKQKEIAAELNRTVSGIAHRVITLREIGVTIN